MNTVERMILLSMKLSEMTSNDEIKWKLEKEEPISISQIPLQFRTPLTLLESSAGYGNSYTQYIYKTEFKGKVFRLIGVEYLGGIDVRLQILNKQGTLEFESNNSFFQDLFRVVRQQQQQYGNENDVYRFIDELILDPESEFVNT
jgi:hypothetical protein